MMLILLLIVLVLLLGPLRPWSARHWAFLASIGLGALSGWVLGCVIMRFCGSLTFLPLLGAVVGAWELGSVGPSILRKIDNDGKE